MSMMIETIQAVKAFAPATSANVAVGFDILGFAIESIGDYVTLTKRDDDKVIIASIDANEPIPLASDENVASVVVKAFCRALHIKTGFSIEIKKGIPLCSGLGGSAASAVAALVACNAFLKSPLSTQELASFALIGEKLSSGAAHPDNLAPCLWGGLTLILSQSPLDVVALPIPNLYCVLVHPALHVPTRAARDALKKEIELTLHVQQSAYLASFIAALYTNDDGLLKKALHDVLIEPQRAHWVPGFYAAKKAAMEAGAMAMSLSGSGPTLFAFTKTKEGAERVCSAMQASLREEATPSNSWVSRISHKGAHVVENVLWSS